jgi:hypothetical protein
MLGARQQPWDCGRGADDRMELARLGRCARCRARTGRATRRRREEIGTDHRRDSGHRDDARGGDQPAPLRGGERSPLPSSRETSHRPHAVCRSGWEGRCRRFGRFSRRARLDAATRRRTRLDVVTRRRARLDVVTRRWTRLDVAWRRRGRGALEDVLDGFRSLAPEVGGARRNGGPLCERAQLASVRAPARLIAAIRCVVVTRRADGHELVAGAEPVDREPHDVRSLPLNVLGLRPFCVYVSQQSPQ